MDNNVVAKHILDVAVGLDKKSKNELIVELSDIFDNASKIDLNSKENIESLKNLAKAFEAIFSKAGNKSINFADIIKMPPPAMFAEMGKIAATAFWDAWNSVNNGIGRDSTQEMMRDKFKQLEQQKVELIKRQKALPKKQREYEELSSVVDDLPYMDTNEFEAFTKEELKKMGDNVEKIALDMQRDLVDALDNLSDTKLDDPKYDNVLEDTLKKARDVFRMSRTLENNPALVKDQTILEDYDFAYLQENYSEELEDHSIRLSGIIRKIDAELGAIPVKLKEIDKQLVQIQNSGVNIVNNVEAKNGLKTLNEIEEAYKNISVASGDRIDDRQAKHILSALEFDPSKSGEGIKKLYEQYQDAAASGNWVEEYRALLKYVRLYESYLTTENQAHRNKITKRGNEFTPLYEQLKPMADNARNMLQNLLNMGEGKPLVGMDGAGGDSSIAGPTQEEIANAARLREEIEAKARAEKEAREEAEKKLLAEREIEEVMQRQRIEEEKIVNEANKNQAAYSDAIGGVSDTIDNLQVVDDDAEVIAKENGALEDKLELLQDIAEQYGNNITQKNRDRYEELNQKDMNDGLTAKEDERYWELGEQIDEADRALEEFGQTYDKIIVKLANGKKVEILPDDKGLRTLAKIDEEYGESYNGVAIEDVVFERVKQEVAATKQATDVLNESLERTQQLISGGSTGDASSADLEAERARVEALQTENDSLQDRLQKQADEMADEAYRNQEARAELYEQLSNAEAEVAAAKDMAQKAEQESLIKDNAIQALREQLANAKTGSGDASSEELEATRIQSEQLREENSRLQELNAELEESSGYYRDALYDEAGRANAAEERVAELERQVSSSFEGGEKPSSANTEELKTLLNSIVYNVKIAHDDNDKQANKIALDDSSLEQTLTKVFANIIKPDMSQDGDVQNQEPWALENTLQTIKGVIDNIQINTSKIAPSNVDTIAGTALDGKLTEIKSVLESIDNKIAKGGVITKKGDTTDKKQKQGGQNQQAARSNAIKSLVGDYERLGKLRAQFDKDGNLETKAKLQNLADEVATKRTSLKLTTDEILGLREKSDLAYKAEQRLIEAAKAQKEINDQRKAEVQNIKQQEKDVENAFKKRVKDAQRATGINAATSAVNAGDQTVLRAIGTEGISNDIENKARELSDNIKALRVLRDEIDKKGNQTSDEDRDNLSKQIAKVKELKSEVDGYLKLHEKYSGDNVTDLGDASNFGSVGTDQYWNNITAAIKNASNGRVAIKGMDADTGELTGTTKIAANTFAEWSATVDPLTGRLSMLRTGIKKTETIIEQIKRKTKEVFTYFSGSSIIFKAVNELKKGIQYVRDIDLALTELKKVTDETEETYDKFLKTAAKTGARLGSTISAVTEATATFAKLGYSIEQASEMAEAAIVYKNVGDNIESTEDAANSIISTLKGFGMAASESMAIVDKFNEVGNRFAITSQGIGEALRLSASALNEGKNSLDESIALITAANEVVNDPSSVGTALKTLTLRLRGSKTELEEMGEDVSDMATTTSQLQAKLLALTGGKVDIMLDANTFKNSTQILREMAAAWEDMNDIQRANALELMGGKRQANVLSALIQNFDTVEKVIDTSANSAGSALKENERYLDSIQGKIDQFNNATQSMWSNFLDDDVVKFVVELGTKLIKLIDNIGMIPSSLGAVLIYLTAFKKQNPFDLIRGIGQYLNAFKGWDGFKQLLGRLLGVVPAMKMITAETVANTVATQAQDAALSQDLMTKMGLANVTGNLSIVQKEQAASALFAAFTSGQLSQAQASAMLATLGYKLSLDGATWSLKTLDTTTKSFMATNPIGWVLAIVSVLMTVVTLLAQIPNGVEKLSEEISDLKSEISDLESEIDSINSELKTTEERIAELLAMPSLSFVEQEELNNLQQTTAELERQLELKGMLAKSREEELISKSEEYINKVWHNKNGNMTYQSGVYGEIGEGNYWNGGYDATKDALNAAMESYQKLYERQHAQEYLLSIYDSIDWNNIDAETNRLANLAAGTDDIDYSKWFNRPRDMKVDRISKNDWAAERNKIAASINMVFADENFDGLKYGMSDKIDAFLDEVYAYQYKWQEAQGVSSKSSFISSIFDDTASENIKNLKESLTEIANDSSLDNSQKQTKGLELVSKALNSTTKDYDRLKTSMEIIGITADEVVGYFVQLSNSFDSSTVEGITDQYQKGVDALNKYKDVYADAIAEFTNIDGTIEKITWGSLFDDSGNVIDEQISKVLRGADETARKEFARLAKAVNEGTMSVDDAMRSFSLSGVQEGYKLIEASVIEINSDIFKDLGDDISGLIDTFEEFGSALESVAKSMELVTKAEAEMAYSGHLSVETALELINSTEDWNKVLKVENGNITLVDGAMDILAQSKLNQIKTNLQLALSEAQAGLEQARLAESSGEVAKTLEESTTESVRQLAANMEYLSTLVGEFLSGNFLGAGSAARAAKESSLAATAYQKTSSASSMSVADWEEKVSNIEAKLGILEGVDTTEEFNNNYYSDEVSGGNNTKAEVADDRFQQEMEYWENRIAANQAKYEQLQNEIDLLESKGQRASKEYYDEQLDLIEEKRKLLEGEDGTGGQKGAALAYLEELEAAGKEGSEEWWDVANTLNDIESELDDVVESTVDLQDAIGEIDTYKFDEFNTRLDNLTSKLETIRSIIAPNGEEDWFDDEGNWTEDGVAVLGSQLQSLEMYKKAYQDTVDELAKYESPYAGNESYYESLGIHSEQEYYDKTEELISQQYEFAESISDTKQSVVDMYESSIDAVEDYVDTLIDGYNDYIDSVKEALDAERDLYDFKKNVQKQAKDIAAIERRIASLSGSTNAADIAERRKLEAQLYESRESLNDTYYDHATDAQSDALDAEAQAYEETMTKMVEDLRTSLQEATSNMDEFLMGVTTMVMYNADTVLAKYEETNLPLTKELTNPWEEAKNAVGSYSGNALDLMNQWTKEGGFFAQFNTTGTTSLTSPWSAGANAATNFGVDVGNVMKDVKDNIATNVKSASDELSNLYQQILDTEERANNAVLNPTEPTKQPSEIVEPNVTATATLKWGGKQFAATRTAKLEADAKKSARDAAMQSAYSYYKQQGKDDLWIDKQYSRWLSAITYKTYAKGATGTKRDQWAITDEPKFGDELVLVPTAQGNLSYMRKGTGVVPADLTANLMEWGQFTPDSINLGGGVNVNMINNAVIKPQYDFSFDSLVHVDNCSQETLKDLEKMVDNKIDKFSKELNYSIKRFAR